jgi:iron(III) transport system permease protein
LADQPTESVKLVQADVPPRPDTTPSPNGKWSGDKARNAIITLIVAVFFFFALLYPLSYALIDAVRGDVLREKKDGETWAAFSERTGVNADRLWQLNNVKPQDVRVPTTPIKTSAADGTSVEIVPQKGENWTALSKRVGVPVAALKRDTLLQTPLRNPKYAVGRTFTIKHLLRLFEYDAPQWRWIINSLLLAFCVTLACAVISYPLAYLQARTSFRGQFLLNGLLLLPLIMPPFVGAIGLRRLLSKYGTINLFLMELGIVDYSAPIDFLDKFRFAGVVLVMVMHFYPLLYLNLAAAISNIDPSLLESSRNLGMTPWQTFRRVIFPLSIPGFVAGGTLVFIGAFTDLGTPLIFGYQETVAKQIFSLANEQSSNPAAPALVAVVTLIVLGLFALTRWSIGRQFSAGGLGVKGQTRAAPNALSSRMTVLAVGLHLAVIGLAVLPHISVVMAALAKSWFNSPLPPMLTTENLTEALSHPVAIMGMRNSLLYSMCSTLIDIALGLACAWAIVRGGGWWGRVLDGLSLAPLAVPGLVLAFGYVGAYAKIYTESTSFFTSVGFFLILSYSIRRLPYTVRACAAGLEQTPRALEEAAGSLGATPSAVIRQVTLPLIFANVIAGAILAFAFAMLEVSDSLILAARPENFPLTKAIYGLFSNPGNGDQLASALGLVALVFLSLSLLAAAAVLGKRWGQMFKG